MFPSLKLPLAAVAAVAVSASALAGGEPPGLEAAGKVSPMAISTSHKLLKSFFDTANEGGKPLGAGSFTTVGSQLTLNCANTAGCTIAGNFSAQLGAGASENNAAVCVVVDGASVSCPFNSIIRPGGGFQVMNYQTFTSVALGNHTVDMQVFSSTASTLFRWNKEIKLYKP
ncbi:hypothetical protein [Ideonella sp.]|uniref:hypothetical protein n=1 Tax=Ideonella sp. TaxID=1929293 RepID=UPI002B49C152|nr:hypothetical protein [Ideonella sp.]HJV68360.1 hypothetical protein [Ideonella sp.]